MGYIYDSVNPLGIPAGVDVVAGYVDGAYANIEAMRKAHPQAYVLEITVTGRPGVRVVDCERGDLTPEQAAAWAHTELKAGRKPTVYCSESTWPDVIEYLKKLRVHQTAVEWWIASWTTVARAAEPAPELFAGAVARQYASDVPHNGSAYDLSITQGRWPLAPLPDNRENVVRTSPGSRTGVVRTNTTNTTNIEQPWSNGLKWFYSQGCE
jgi:hypothetical protein